MKRIVVLSPLVLLLVAAGALPIQAGKWQSTVTIISMQMPGVPAAALASVRGKPTVVTACVTAAQAADGPRAVMGASNGKCRYTRFDASGGRLSAVMTCNFASSAMTTTSFGTYTATTMDLDGTATMTTPRGPSVTKTHVSAHRLGAC